MSNIASYYCVKSDKFRRHYKRHSSGFDLWDQKSHAEDFMLFPENIGPYLSIDEVSTSRGELYTFVTNKAGKGKKGTLIASVKGTRSKDIIEVLQKLTLQVRSQVKEVTLDMAKNMESAVRTSFPRADLVTDRFHVVKLVIDALQHVRIKLRWEAIDQENSRIKQSKQDKKRYIPKLFENGDTSKQLLARSRHILAKKPSKWTENQAFRAQILFREHPELKEAYHHSMEFRGIYEELIDHKARARLLAWILTTKEVNIQEFNTAAHSIEGHLENIINFFKNRNTNANAESFNAKIKLFRANLRGVTDIPFFLFRLQKLFA